MLRFAVHVSIFTLSLATCMVFTPEAYADASTGQAGSGVLRLQPPSEGSLTRATLVEAVQPASVTLGANDTVISNWEQDAGDPVKTSSAAPAATPGWTTILYEDAEGSFPSGNGWTTYDANAASGNDYWDDLSCRSFTGSWSVWCADIGDQTNCANYDNDMSSWMIYGPFSLADAADARAEFYVWSETERPDIPFDSLFWGVSINGSSFHGYRLTSNVGWSLAEVDFQSIPSLGDVTGEPQVWFAFKFTSDSTVNSYEGSYVDNVLIEKLAPTDLEALEVFFRDQPGNAGNVIDNPTPSEVVYPHFRYAIHGSTGVSGKLWEIELNNVLQCSYTSTDPAGQYVGWCNSGVTLAPGLHSLHGEVDPDGTISETNGGNNDAFRNYDVGGDPEISISPLILDFTPGSSAASAHGAATEPSAPDWGEEQMPEIREETVQHLSQKAARQGKVDVIVGLDVDFQPEGRLPGPAAVIAQRNAIAAAQASLLQRLGHLDARPTARFQYIPSIALSVGQEALEALAAFREVTSIEENVPIPPLMSSSNPVIGSPAAWAKGFTGAGQTVAILDTGVDKSHPFFTTGGDKVVSEACYSTSNSIASSLCPGAVSSSTATGSGVNCSTTISGCDHGTHVAGSAVGNDGTGPHYGVARGADVIAIQVFSRFDSSSSCSPRPAPCVRSYLGDQIEALERVYALRNTFDIASVNLSLGGDRFFTNCDTSFASYKMAVDNLRSVEIATVVAAANDGYRDSMGMPACISSVVSVGATTDGDSVASFSNVADFLSLLAPGVSITSAVPGTGTGTKSGTSMAAPHVAGAWAILKQADPSLSVDEVLTALHDTGTSVDDDRSGGTVTDMRRINVDLALDQVGSSATKSFTIANLGDGTLSVTDIQLGTAASWITWSPQAPFDVAPGASQAVSVTVDFSAAPSGQSSRRLRVQSNDSDESPYPGGVYVNVDKPDAGAPDLVVTDVTVSDTSPAIGQSFTTSAIARNQGDAASDATTLRYYRSGDATISTADTLLSTDGVVGMAAGGSDPESDVHSIATAGTYWIGACIDSVAAESNTGNNCSTGVQVEVAGCSAPATITLQNTTLDTNQTYEACQTINLGPNLAISADVVTRAGQNVVFRPPVSILTGGSLSVYIEAPSP